MRKYYLLINSLLIVNFATAQWFEQNSGTTKDLISCFFTDSNTGYVVGQNIILKTTDGGNNWIQQYISPQRLNSVFFINSDTGYAVGYSGLLMSTNDGGEIWTSKTISTYDFNSIYFGSSKIGYIVGGSTGSNGGNIGLKTKNGGRTWNLLYSGGPATSGSIVYEVFFTDEDNGYFLDNSYNATQGICRTITGGDGWVCDDYWPGVLIQSFYFTDSISGYAVGRNSSKESKIYKGSIYKMTNGESWELQNSGIQDDLYSVFFTDSINGYTVGEYGAILKTTDGGINWKYQSSGTSETLLRVFFTDQNTGYIVGKNGKIFKTTNGGNPLGVNENINTAKLLKIYTNSTSNNLTIELSNFSMFKNTSLTIYNLNGQLIFNHQITEPKMHIDISTLQSGVYFVRTMGKNNIVTGKFIKQ